MIALLQISWRMWQWKNFENRPVFDEVMCRLRWLTFFGPPCTLNYEPIMERKKFINLTNKKSHHYWDDGGKRFNSTFRTGPVQCNADKVLSCSSSSNVHSIVSQSINQSIEEFVTRTVVDGSSRIWGAGSRRAAEVVIRCGWLERWDEFLVGV